MAKYKIKYAPNNNIINVSDFNNPNNCAIIFYYLILRCESHAEVRIWCDQCSLRECIYTCPASRIDAEIVEEVNRILDDAIDSYADKYLVDPDWDMGLDDGHDRNGHYRHCPWCN